MKFAYVTFVNYNLNYIQLMKVTIDSIKTFSSFPLILYCVDFPFNTNITDIFDNLSDQIIIRYINNIHLQNIYYYKPYVILDVIKNGLESGYYIESDDVMSPNADLILQQALKQKKLNEFPISPIHPDDAEIPKSNYDLVGVERKTGHYIHAHVLFTISNLKFVEEWLSYCLKSNTYRNADETVLNLLYWKHNLKNHHLDLIDPWYENFYTNPHNRNSICSYHGCKDALIARQLFEDMKKYYFFSQWKYRC